LRKWLELAVKRIPSEAGWLLLADLNRRDLYVATATGPKAEEVIKYRLPMGRGIAGFCAVNGMSLVLSDVEQDRRFQLLLSRSVGLEVGSVACSPIQHEGRVYGALQIMNHARNPEYSPGELDVLNYIARRTAEFLAARVRL
jgi:GAF domain-containing protein